MNIFTCLENLPNLTALDLSNEVTFVGPNPLVRALSLLTNLTELSLSNFIYEDFGDCLSNLKLEKLHLCDCPLKNDKLHPLLSLFPLIQDLSLEGTAASSENEISQTIPDYFKLRDSDRCPSNLVSTIADGMPYLQFLNLQSKFWILNAEELKGFLPPKLELLNLSVQLDETAASLLPKFVHLEYLDLSESPVYVNVMIRSVASASLASLKKLVLRNLPYDAEANLSPLSALPSLRTLNLLSPSGIVDSSTIKHLPSLTALAVASFNRHTEFMEDLRQLKRLKFLKVTTMPRVDLERLTQLSGLCTTGKWRYYSHRERGWKFNPHENLDFPIHL